MINIRKFLEGIRILPKTTLSSDSAGEIEVDNSGKLNYHNGSDRSPVVTEEHAATLTNKTISGDDNTFSNINATSISDGSVDNTEFGYLSGVTSSIQDQLDDKVNTSNPSFTGTITTDLTASSVITTNATSELVASTVTDTELGYLSGVTSSIQDQLDDKSEGVDKAFTTLNADTWWGSPLYGVHAKSGDAAIVANNNAFKFGSTDTTDPSQKTAHLSFNSGANVGLPGGATQTTGDIYFHSGDADGNSDTGYMFFDTGYKPTGSTGGNTGFFQAKSGDVVDGGGNTGFVKISSGNNQSTGDTGYFIGGSGDATGGDSGDSTIRTGDGNNTGSTWLKTGNASGNSGDINIQPGTAAGTRGGVKISSPYVAFRDLTPLVFHESGNIDYVGFKAPPSIPSPIIWTLPSVDGANGEALVTDGSGNLSWSNTGGGANTTLSNLSPTAINQYLIFGSGQTGSLDTAAVPGGTSQGNFVTTGSAATSGNTTIATGPGTIQSGNVIITSGAAPTRGTIELNGLYIDATSKQIKNLATPTLATDAVNKSYVDARVGSAFTAGPGSTGNFSTSLTSAQVITNCSVNFNTTAGKILEITLIPDGNVSDGLQSHVAVYSATDSCQAYINLEVNASYVQRQLLGSTSGGSTNQDHRLPPGSVRFIYQATITGSATYRLTASAVSGSTVAVRYCQFVIREIY